MSFGDWLKSFAHSGPVVTFEELPDGFPGTALVVAKMRLFAVDGVRDERLNQLARALTKSVPSRDRRGEAAAILRYLQPGGTGGYRYTALPWAGRDKAFQRLQHPSYTLIDAPSRSGECASLTVAYATLAMCLGHEVRFRTAGRDETLRFDHEHVYALDGLDGRSWTAVDPSYAESLGWPHREGDVSPVRTWTDWLV